MLLVFVCVFCLVQLSRGSLSSAELWHKNGPEKQSEVAVASEVKKINYIYVLNGTSLKTN